MIVDSNASPMRLYVTNEAFARKVNPTTFRADEYQAYYCFEVAWSRMSTVGVAAHVAPRQPLPPDTPE